MKGKVVLITGATSGIGYACAEIFAKNGASVVITGRNPERLERAVGRFEQSGIQVFPILADAAKEEDNKRTIADCISAFGRLDVLICNAGISQRSLFEEMTLDSFHQVMDINFYGAVYITKYALPYILESKGSIVAISSFNGHRSTPARSAYSAAKFAMNGFFETLRTEVMHRGAHILVVAPGFTQSNIRNQALMADGSSQGESPRAEEKMMSAETVAIATYRATKARKRDLFLTVEVKAGIFFNKWFPALLDRVIYKIMAREKDSPLKQKKR